jgi:hypothetical protein
VPRIDESYVRQGTWTQEEEPEREEPLMTLFRMVFRG